MLGDLLYPLLALLASLLGEDDWTVRDCAARALAGLYPASAPLLVGLERNPRADPEARTRAARILRDASQQADPLLRLHREMVRQTGYRNWPWVDSLPEGYPDRQAVIQRCLGAAREAGEIGYAPCWPEYRAATAIHLRERLKAGISEGDCLLLLRRMIDGDRRQWERAGTLWEWAGTP